MIYEFIDDKGFKYQFEFRNNYHEIYSLDGYKEIPFNIDMISNKTSDLYRVYHDQPEVINFVEKLVELYIFI